MTTNQLKMKIMLIYSITILCINPMKTQSIERSVISSFGVHAQTMESRIEMTLGEIAIKTINNSNDMLSQGFHQSTKKVSTQVIKRRALETIVVWPNPANSDLNIKLKKHSNASKIQITDLKGKMLLTSEIGNNEITTIALDQLSEGIYLLMLIGENKETLSIQKFIKTN